MGTTAAKYRLLLRDDPRNFPVPQEPTLTSTVTSGVATATLP
jgi:hypothetical protein